MLTKITELPPHVLGIRASGKVLDTKVQKFAAGAWRMDMVAGLKHYTDWHRIAVVTDQKPVELFTDLFEPGVPGKSRGFALDELNEATIWVAENETGP